MRWCIGASGHRRWRHISPTAHSTSTPHKTKSNNTLLRLSPVTFTCSIAVVSTRWQRLKVRHRELFWRRSSAILQMMRRFLSGRNARLSLAYGVKRGCLGGLPRSSRSLLSFNGRLIRSPFRRCDSMKAKINSVLAYATRTPPRVGSPVSSA